MRTADVLPLEYRDPELFVRFRSVISAQSPSATLPAVHGMHFIPSILGSLAVYDLNGERRVVRAHGHRSLCSRCRCDAAFAHPTEILDEPAWNLTLVTLKSNITVTLLQGSNNPNRTAGREFEYSTNNGSWCVAASAAHGRRAAAAPSLSAVRG
jgi:hypothetical protein